MKRLSRRASLMYLGLLAAGAGCGEDLGRCDEEAAVELVYGRSNLVATAGQALAHDSCGNGAFCHSSRAEGSNRVGAPKELDFDMVPEPKGWFTLYSNREAAWGAVEDGSMPPSGESAKLVGDGDWRYDPQRREDSERLPSIRSDEGKEVLRNWLACDAPTVEDTVLMVPRAGRSGAGGSGAGGSDGGGAPVDAGMDTGPIETPPPDWGPIYAAVLQPNCAIAGCHDDRAGAGTLKMGEECGALEALLGSGACSKVRLVPGEPDSSFLLEKLQKPMPSCGVRMPVIAPLPAADIERIEQWIEAGAHSSQCD